MKLLLTGAFGNIGTHTINALLDRQHHLRCFDVRTKANLRTGKKYQKYGLETVWGDLRNPEDVQKAVSDRDVVIHLGFIIPRLSASGVSSEENPDFAYKVNVEGTTNLINAIREMESPAKIIFASSLHVYGRTQHLPPPRRVFEPVDPVENYAHHKVICENLVRGSGLDWTILRLPATLPIRLILDPSMFDVPLGNRIEYAHGKDVATAIANAVESDQVWGKTLLIGGGPRCQFYYQGLVGKIFSTIGLRLPPAEAFSRTSYSTDWLDTSESQSLLRYQQHTLEDYLEDLKRAIGWRLPFIRVFRSIIERWLLNQSPYLHQTDLQ